MSAYSKLKIKINNEVKEVTFNDEIIKVKQYLPIEQKIEIIEKVIALSADENRFYNVGKLRTFLTLQIMYYYTDLSFTDNKKQKVTELYDEFISSGLFDIIKDSIPTSEIKWLESVLNDTAKSIYEYNNSVMGIMKNISTDYTNLGIESSELQKKFADPNNLALVKDILTKLN